MCRCSVRYCGQLPLNLLHTRWVTGQICAEQTALSRATSMDKGGAPPDVAELVELASAVRRRATSELSEAHVQPDAALSSKWVPGHPGAAHLFTSCVSATLAGRSGVCSQHLAGLGSAERFRSFAGETLLSQASFV